MKNITIVLALILVASTSAFAQKRSDLTGPAYKNYKPGKEKSEPVAVYTVAKEEKLTGPAYKNHKPWKNTSDKTYTTIAFGSEKSKLTGPAHKNYKPWRDNKENE
ncbi:hypothetical protein KO566_00995 [Flavobacteriaceae bacterium XHP0103]|uniref:hypothetical protein n=1 Tax=Marixanthotalea marina TaxID=2844359 RepID=UPI002989D046|nr:hypothetical protein [Marixanthotalea marina]MBU3820620.1 hypothetical protein [Marixanthotalea marina]